MYAIQYNAGSIGLLYVPTVGNTFKSLDEAATFSTATEAARFFAEKVRTNNWHVPNYTIMKIEPLRQPRYTLVGEA